MTFLGAWVAINVITATVSVCYTGASIGKKIGKATNRKRFGKYSPHNEIVTIRRGRDCK
jgi:hypothetical protein